MLLQSFILMAILFMSPLHSNSYKEDPGERLERYISISNDISDVVSSEKPMFSGKYAKEKTAIMLASMALHESNFNKNVDSGKKRGKLNEICILQIVPNMKDTKYDYSEKYLLNRKNCITAALFIVRNTKCSENPYTMMRSYVSGRCSKHSDPKKEKAIKKAALGEVRGYLHFTNKYPPKNYFKE